MNLLILILMALGLYASPANLQDPQFIKDNQSTIEHARNIEDQGLWYYDEAGNIVIVEDTVPDK